MKPTLIASALAAALFVPLLSHAQTVAVSDIEQICIQIAQVKAQYEALIVLMLAATAIIVAAGALRYLPPAKSADAVHNFQTRSSP